MAAIKYDNQGDAISRDVPGEALALIDAGGNGSDRLAKLVVQIQLTSDEHRLPEHLLCETRSSPPGSIR